MKITIVCGHFIPAMGYIEVHLARAFADLGHAVTVVTTTAIPAYVAHLHSDFGEAPKDVQVVRLKPFFTLGQVVIAKGVKEAVLDSNPDQIIVIGLGKRFPKEAIGLGIHTTALFGDNAASYGDSPSGKTRLLFEFFKRKTYQEAIEKADRLVAYTPESFEAAGKMLGGKWAKKLAEQNDFISLGFHPDEFFFDKELREEKRVILGFSDEDRVVITATRLKPEKNLEAVIPAFENAEPNVKWLLLGSADDEYAQELKSKLNESLGPDRFTLLSHQKREDLNAFYNAADLALFTTPAISIVEAMGTGIIINAPYFKSLKHLGSSIKFFTDLDEVQEISLMFSSDSVKSRIERNNLNIERFSWGRVTSLLIQDE